ncbi:uncharacterized protein [Epargyreus clarus]|uniref:uncharacterized protein isoform X1 n=1 Tax=Epargyreus clarus TaxID=520877 RepID=UPI003C2D74B1
MLYIGILFACVTACVAQSAEESSSVPLNVITVPPNCPPGQELVNGACREIWSWRNNPSAANLGVIDPSWRNTITVPANCPPNKELINGACREVWRFFRSSTATPDLSDPSWRNVITVPPNCPPGQEFINGVCRDVWRFFKSTTPDPELSDPSWRNVITVPANCPPGQELINGVCRDVWRLSQSTTPIPILRNFELRDRRQTDTEDTDILQGSDPANRNIINIPNQCPIGYKPDALGICRQILN